MSKGFSLVATLAAVSIFALAVAGSLSWMGSSYSTSQGLSREHAAADLAQGILELLANTNLSQITDCGSGLPLNDPCLGISPDKRPLAQCCFGIAGGLVPTETCNGDTACAACSTGFCSSDFKGFYYRIRTDSNPANNYYAVTVTLFYPDTGISLDDPGLINKVTKSVSVTEAVSR